MTKMGLINESLQKQRNFVNIVAQKEGLGKVGLWINWAICFLRYGSTPSDWYCYELYRYRHGTLRKFITRRKNTELDRIFNPRTFSECFNNKCKFNEIYNKFVSRRWFLYPKTRISDIRNYDWKSLIVVKPVNLSSGRGIFTFNPQSDDWDKLKNKLGTQQYLLEECVELHPDLKMLNPPSCQTIRFYTIIDSDGNAKILDAVLRVGGGNSIQDNFHSNGVVYPIDLISGKVMGAGKDLSNNDYLVHPSSGIFMPGYQIPNWEEAKAFALSAASQNKSARFIGWDVAITPTGFEMIEGNYYVYCGLIQIFDKKGKYDLIRSYI